MRPDAASLPSLPFPGQDRRSDAELGTSEARGIGTTPVILALVIGIIAGCGVLWLDHAGLIALRNLDASRLLVTMKAGVRDWWVSLEQLRWRDWYNPPSE